MKILVTGANGFVGRHAVRELTRNGHEALALDLNFDAPAADAADTVACNLLDAKALNGIVRSLKPEACLHLGAISSTREGIINPQNMFAVNITGTINLLEAFRKSADSAKILVVSTSYVYGKTKRKAPIKETDPLSPVGAYAVSKASADLITLSYAKEFKMHTMTARPTNHTGPGQSTLFVVASFSDQIRKIADGKAKPILKVGNLESERVFTDVRDIVRAYRLLIEKGKAGEAYNISSKRRHKIGAILDKLCELAEIKPKIKVDPEKFRPTDSSPVLDITKLIKLTRWKPEIELAQTLRDMLSEQ